jgi:hypothetical protein
MFAMLFRKLIRRFALGAVILIAALPVARSARANGVSAFTTYRNSTPPHRAQGDFDGDGRVDTAVIQERAGESRLSIQLSSSVSEFDLELSVTSVAEGDIDHDGDLDLVTATASGDLAIWLNDGHGRFTRQRASTTRALSSDAVVLEPTSHALSVIRSDTIPLQSLTLRDVPLTTEAIRSPAPSNVHVVQSVIPPPLRAPPTLDA